MVLRRSRPPVGALRVVHRMCIWRVAQILADQAPQKLITCVLGGDRNVASPRTAIELSPECNQRQVKPRKHYGRPNSSVNGRPGPPQPDDLSSVVPELEVRQCGDLSFMQLMKGCTTLAVLAPQRWLNHA